MYSRVRVAVASLALVVMCMVGSTGTLSYFMDSKGVTNNFTVGNASTELAIYDDVTGDRRFLNAGDYSPLEEGTEVPFYLQARNTGNIPVYQRFRIVIPVALKDSVTLDLSADSCMVTSADACSDAKFAVIYDPSVSVNNVEMYAEYYIVSNQVLGVDEVTAEWPLNKIIFDNMSGVSEESLTCTGGSNSCAFGVGVYSDVMQTTGFTAGAVKAFESFTETYN